MTGEPSRRKRGRPPHPDILTPREWQVLDLIRQGLTNEQIALRLDVSLATAKYHVSEIISKLGVTTREEAAAWQPEGVAVRWWQRAIATLAGGLRRVGPFAAAVGVVAALGGLALLLWALRRGDDEGPAEVAQPSSEPPSPAAQIPASTVLPGIDWGWRNIADAACVDSQHCWLTAGNDVLASTDGGVHWRRQYEARNGQVGLGAASVDFVSAEHGWATTSVSLMETEDGGQTWNEVTISEPPHDVSGSAIPQGIDFVNDRDGFSFLGPALGTISLSRTEDGGRTWKPMQTPCPDSKVPSAPFDFISLATGWYLCVRELGKTIRSTELYRTLDGGDTWDRMSDLTSLITGNLSPIYGLAFTDEEDGWLSAGRAGLFATHDGGASWTQLAAWPPDLLANNDNIYPFAQLSFISSGEALLITRTAESSTLFRTTDSGRTWAHLYPPPPGADARPCTAEDLMGDLLVQGATQSLVGGMRFTNRSDSPCSLRGIPQINALDLDGNVLIASRNATEEGATVVIYPGQSASTPVFWSSRCNIPPGTATLVATLPGGQDQVTIQRKTDPGPASADPAICDLDGQTVQRTIDVAAFEPSDPPINPP